MDRSRRIRILKTLAQANPSAGAPASAPGTTTTAPATTTTPTTTTTNTTTPVAVNIDLQAIPGYRAELFSQRPDLIVDMSKVVNVVNSYLQQLSQNKVNFKHTWLNPSISPSEYTNSLKNLYSLAKWLFSVLTTNQTKYYTVDGLKQIANGLMSTVRAYSFPEPIGTQAQSQLVAMGQSMLAKLGTTT